jgi:hypothetical protein
MRGVVDVNIRIIGEFTRLGKGGTILVAGAGQGDEAEIIQERTGSVYRRMWNFKYRTCIRWDSGAGYSN